MNLFASRAAFEKRLIVFVILVWVLLSTMYYFDRLGFYPGESGRSSLLMDAWSFVNFPGIQAFSYREGHIGQCTSLGGTSYLDANIDCSKYTSGIFLELDPLGYCWFVLWPLVIFFGLYSVLLWVFSAKSNGEGG